MALISREEQVSGGGKKGTFLDQCMFIAVFFEEWLQWNRRSHFEPLCSVTIFSTASLVQMCIFRMEVAHELRSVECSHLCQPYMALHVCVTLAG